MHDPDEGVRPDGTIVTGARRERVPVVFEPVITAAVDELRGVGGDVALYLYGSVATGRARAARRWAEVDPRVAPGMAALVDWIGLRMTPGPTRRSVEHMVDGTVMDIVEAFRVRIGLGRDHTADHAS